MNQAMELLNSPVQRYFMRLSYCGSFFQGWQIQNQGRTVQGELEKALALITRQPIRICGAGRTDTGVHAQQMWIHFDALPLCGELENWVDKLNRVLPWDIVAYSLVKVPAAAHARFDAVSRTYHYHLSAQRSPFRHNLQTYIPYLPDFDAMNLAAQHLLGLHDFTTFSKTHTDVRTHNCTVHRAIWRPGEEPDEMVFEISADRFLRNMVRAIVGQLLLVGRKKMTVTRFGEILNARNRQLATVTAPANGLFLHRINYPTALEELLYPPLQ